MLSSRLKGVLQNDVWELMFRPILLLLIRSLTILVKAEMCITANVGYTNILQLDTVNQSIIGWMGLRIGRNILPARRKVEKLHNGNIFISNNIKKRGFILLLYLEELLSRTLPHFNSAVATYSSLI